MISGEDADNESDDDGRRRRQFRASDNHSNASSVPSRMVSDASDISRIDENMRYRRASDVTSTLKEKYRRAKVVPQQLGEKLRRSKGGMLNFSTAEIRKLFRSFDRNNDLCLEHREFQQGMLMMGLNAASDPYAFSKIIEEVDVDKTGLIDEEEFTTFFRRYKFQEIEKKLEARQSIDDTTIYVTNYGYTSDETEVIEVNGKDFAKWLKEHPTVPRGRKRWFDMRGYNLHIMQLMGLHHDLHGEIIKDAGYLQPNKFDVHHVTRGAKGRSHNLGEIIIQCLSMVGSPFKGLEEHSWISALTRKSLDHEELLSARQMFNHPPTITQRQITMLCLGDDMLITVVKDAVGLDEDGYLDETDPSYALYSMLDDIRDHIVEQREDVSATNAPSKLPA